MRPKTCPYCRDKFQPERQMQPCCDKFECKSSFIAEHIAKQRKTRAQAEKVAQIEGRKTVKIKLEALKTPKQKKSQLIQKAEKAVRDYRRTYELMKGSGCMSCGKSQQEVIVTLGWIPGGAFDAGHYHGKGARPNLRLTPDNIWLQCKSCNGGSAKYARKGATVSKKFRESLIKEIGIERVEELDADDKARHWTDEELIEIHATYAAKLKELKK